MQVERLLSDLSVTSVSIYGVHMKLLVVCILFYFSVTSQSVYGVQGMLLMVFLYADWNVTTESVNCVLLDYHTVCTGNSLSRFWDNLLIPPSKMGVAGCPKMSVRNHKYTLHNSPVFQDRTSWLS